MQKSSKLKLNQKIIQVLLLGSSFFIVPCLTIFLGSKANMLTNNFTYLANQSETQALFLVWMILSVLTHFYLFYSLFKSLKMNLIILPLLFLTMIGSALIPYEKGYSLAGFFHVVTAYLAFALYNTALFKIYTNCQYYQIKFHQFLFSFYLIMLGVCFSITLYYGSINGLVEVIFCIITPILLGILKIKVAEATHH